MQKPTEKPLKEKPLQDFVLKMQGGLMHEGRGGVFAGHYSRFKIPDSLLHGCGVIVGQLL